MPLWGSSLQIARHRGHPIAPCKYRADGLQRGTADLVEEAVFQRRTEMLLGKVLITGKASEG